MSSTLNDIEQTSPGAVRRLFEQESPNIAALTIPATVVAQPAAATECDDDPRTPSDLDDDRRRLDALEREVERYKGLLGDVNHYPTISMLISPHRRLK